MKDLSTQVAANAVVVHGTRKALIEKTIAEFSATRAECCRQLWAYTEGSLPMHEDKWLSYVIVTSRTIGIKFYPGLTGPHARGILQATTLFPAKARELAAQIRNGNGEKAEAILYTEALKRVIADLDTSIAQLSGLLETL